MRAGSALTTNCCLDYGGGEAVTVEKQGTPVITVSMKLRGR